jgi:hemolysin activation/secretion protein
MSYKILKIAVKTFVLALLFALSLEAAVSTVFIKKVLIDGNLTKDEKNSLQKIIKPYYNKNITLQDIQKIKSRITSFYHNKGHLFVKVILPAQDLSNGILRYKVIKAKTGDIKITGNKYFTKKFILKHTGLKKGTFFNYDKLIKSLMLLNEYNDLEVKSYLKKGKKFAQTNVNLLVKDKKPFHGYLSFDNLGSKDTSKYRVSADISYGNFLSQGDESDVLATIGLNSANTKLFRVNYKTTPLNSYFTRLTLGYLYANYITSGDFAVLELKGNTNIYSFGILQPIVRTSSDKLDISLTYNKKDTKSYLLGSLSSKNSINTLELSTNWQHMRVFDATSLNFLMTKGFSGDVSFGSRLDEVATFAKYNLNIEYNRYINKKNNIKLNLNSQYSSDRLPLSEMFTIGGLSSVRGYDSAVKLGDYGYGASLEWFYKPSFKNTYLKDGVTLGLFADYAKTYANNPVPGEEKSVSLLGSGIEMMLNIKKKYFARLSIGFPLHSSSSNIDNNAKVYLWVSAKLW